MSDDMINSLKFIKIRVLKNWWKIKMFWNEGEIKNYTLFVLMYGIKYKSNCTMRN